MSSQRFFSVARWWGVVRKEFLQLRRDRITFAMIVAIPIVQLTLFGYAIILTRSTFEQGCSYWIIANSRAASLRA